MMLIENEHDLGDTVYLKTDDDQHARLVTAIVVRPHGLLYELACGSSSSWHVGFEISTERDVLKATSSD